jgi:hypothetical protein
MTPDQMDKVIGYASIAIFIVVIYLIAKGWIA